MRVIKKNPATLFLFSGKKMKQVGGRYETPATGDWSAFLMVLLWNMGYCQYPSTPNSTPLGPESAGAVISWEADKDW